MTTTPATLGEGTVPSGSATILMTPTTGAAVITQAVFSNVTANPVSLQVWLVRSGGGAGNGNLKVPSQVIPPNGTFVSPELAGMVLAAGDAIYGEAGTAAALTYTLNGATFS